MSEQQPIRPKEEAAYNYYRTLEEKQNNYRFLQKPRGHGRGRYTFDNHPIHEAIDEAIEDVAQAYENVNTDLLREFAYNARLYFSETDVETMAAHIVANEPIKKLPPVLEKEMKRSRLAKTEAEVLVKGFQEAAKKDRTDRLKNLY